MSTLAWESKGRWTIATVGALVSVAALLTLVRLPAPPLVPGAPAAPTRAVELARPDTGRGSLIEETLMRDLTPLFLPTERNAQLPLAPLREPGETVLDFQPLRNLQFNEADPGIARNLPAVATLNGQAPGLAQPIDALPREDGVPALGFGRKEAVVIPMTPRGPFVEVVALATGRTVLADALPLDARPATDQPWIPLEFTAAVDPAGLIAPLLLTTGSRVDIVDAHFKNYLVRSYRIAERLAPGFYRITIGP
ncbi:MAG TPA: hypothetical protein VM029_03125 [Opitutaceae bacterium]|nr:hypothetical protein [Opitutaceae bacterium]